MREVGAPQRAVRRRFHDALGDRNRLVIGRHRDALGAAHLHPHMLVLEELEQRLERRLVDAILGRHAAHVIDHHRHGLLEDQVRQLLDIRRIDMEHQMPAERLDLAHHAFQQVEIRHAAEMLDEVEADAPHAGQSHLRIIGRRRLRIDDRHAAVVFRPPCECVEHRAVVAAVARRLHDDGPVDAEMRMQRREILLRRILRRVAPVRCVRKHRAGAEHVTMGIGRSRRELERRFASLGEISRHLLCPSGFVSASRYRPSGSPPTTWRCRRSAAC